MKLRPTPTRAFTLIEIMIVVGIIGVLAAFAVPNYVKARAASYRGTCINNLRQIASAIDQYATEAKKKGSDSVTEAEVLPYLKGQVVCPAGGTSFSDSYQLSTISDLPLCISRGGGTANGHVMLQ